MLTHRKRLAAHGMAPEVSWPGAVPLRDLTCPTCDTEGGKTMVLGTHFPPPGEHEQHRSVPRCHACTCLFYDNRSLPDHAGEAMHARGRTAFYLQQGAGLLRAAPSPPWPAADQGERQAAALLALSPEGCA